MEGAGEVVYLTLVYFSLEGHGGKVVIVEIWKDLAFWGCDVTRFLKYLLAAFAP